MVVRGQREKIQNGQMRDKKSGDKGGARLQYQQRGPRLYSGGIHVGGVQGGGVTVLCQGSSSKNESCQEF